VWTERLQRFRVIACNAHRFVQAQEYADIRAPIFRMPIFR
jgi:hypothetical protein